MDFQKIFGKKKVIKMYLNYFKLCYKTLANINLLILLFMPIFITKDMYKKLTRKGL